MASQDALVPACGGTEQPFVVNGRRWLYCWQPSTGKHCYLDLDNDFAVWHRSFHPAFSPEYEFCEEDYLVSPPAQVSEPPYSGLYF